MDPKDLSDAVRRRVSATIYNRGRMYYLEGRVRSIRTDGGVVEAEVAGTDDYTVRIRLEDEPVIRCNCPFGGICKHAVAVALKAADVPPGQEGPGPDVIAEVEDLVRLEATARRKAEHAALRKRADALLVEIGRRDPVERETALRRSVEILEDGGLADPFLDAWIRTIGEMELDGAAAFVGKLLTKDQERGLRAISAGVFSEGDAEVLLSRLPTEGDPIESDLAAKARVHLMGTLGRTADILEIVRGGAPVEAIEEGCRHLSDLGRGDECLPLVIEAMEGRTPRERRALHVLAADLESTMDGRIGHLRRGLELWVDRDVMGRLVDASPEEAVGTALGMEPEIQVLLAEVLLEKDEVEALADLALGSDDVDMVEWIAEEADPSIDLAEHLTDLLMTSKGRDVLWRVRRRLEDLADHPGLPALRERLLDRYPRRGGLRRLLDDIGREPHL